MLRTTKHWVEIYQNLQLEQELQMARSFRRDHSIMPPLLVKLILNWWWAGAFVSKLEIVGKLLPISMLTVSRLMWCSIILPHGKLWPPFYSSLGQPTFRSLPITEYGNMKFYTNYVYSDRYRSCYFQARIWIIHIWNYNYRINDCWISH